MNPATDPWAALTAAAAEAKDVEGFCVLAARALRTWVGDGRVTVSHGGPSASCSAVAGHAPDASGEAGQWSWTDEAGLTGIDLEICPALLLPESPTIETLLAATGALANLVADRRLARQAAERTDALLDASPIPFAIVSSTGELILVNHAFATLAGRSDTESLAMSALASLPYSEATAPPADLLNAAEAGVSWTGVVTLQLGENERSCNAALTPMSGESNELLLMLHDRTEEWSAQREVIAREKLATAGEIASGVAHEVNNPLAAIRIEAELIAAGSDEDTAESARVIMREVDRASHIAKTLIHLTRRSDRELRPIQVNDLLLEVIDLRSQLDNWTHIQLKTRLETNLPIIMGPMTDLRQVFFNLITNAEDAIEGHQNAVIEVGSEYDDDAVRISVSDSGHGIPVPMRQRIFDPFFTTKDPDKGSGLGLSLSHGVVAELGGKIWVEESQLGGARFIVQFPLTTARWRA